MTKDKNHQKVAPFRIWGVNLDSEAVRQMDEACSLPVSIKGALMPDAHKGYGLPIGGVLAVELAAIAWLVSPTHLVADSATLVVLILLLSPNESTKIWPLIAVLTLVWAWLAFIWA